MSTYPTPQQNERSHYRVYTTQFIELRNAIEVATELFSQDKIWPDQCDYIVYKIKPLQKAANRIVALASSGKKQQRNGTGNNRYSILVGAQYFCDQIDALIAYIGEYKETAENKSAARSKHRLIMGSLHNLDASLRDLIKELDQAMPHSRLI